MIIGMGPQSNSHWRRLYEAAVLEINLGILPIRIEAAKKAIHARMGELALSDENGQWEALTDALNVLEDLRKMDLAHRQELRRKAEH